MSTFKCIALFAAGNLFNIGGLQRSYSILTKHLATSGHKVILIGWASDGMSRDDLAYPIDERVDIIFIKQERTAKNFDKIVKVLGDFPIDVILIVNSGYQAIFLSMIALKLGKPYIVSLRGSMEYCLRYLWPSRFALDLLFKSADAAHVLMPSYKNFFSNDLQRKIVVIPSQIEPATLLAQPSEADSHGSFCILYSGRLSFEKRVDLLVDAFASISHDYTNWMVKIVGNGPLKDSLVSKVKSCGMQNRIVFLEAKNTEEMYSIYPKTHIKVLPSEQEGCPMALREAMAHGLPVIAFSECSGANEIISDGIDGLLISNHPDRITSLAAALSRLMSNPNLRISLGKSAINTAALYVPQPINQAWEKLLISVCKEPVILPDLSYISAHEEETCSRHLLYKFIEQKRYTPPYKFKCDDTLLKENLLSYALIYGQELFQTKFYLDTYFSIKRSGEDPLLHYLTVGYKNGYNPSPKFDTKKYQELYMHTAYKNIDPLTHFYLIGRFNGAKPIPIEDRESII